MNNAIKFFTIFSLALVSCSNDEKKHVKNDASVRTETQAPQLETISKPNLAENEKVQPVEIKKKYKLTAEDRKKYTPEQQKTIEKQLKWINDPEWIEAQAKRLEKERKFRRKKMLAELEGNGLSYDLGKGHLVYEGQDFEVISKIRCVTAEDIIKSNPRLKLGNNRVIAPFAGLVLNLPDYACSNKNTRGLNDRP